jgi:uncharacterized membrane protein
VLFGRAGESHHSGFFGAIALPWTVFVALARQMQVLGSVRQVNTNIQNEIRSTIMEVMLLTPVFAAVGYSIIYLLLGGGLFGAFLIFVVAKMMGG